MPSWEYQWLVEVPEASGSWVLPIDVTRRSPQAGTPTVLAIAQIRAALEFRPQDAPRPVVTFDSNYDPIAFADRRLDIDALVRLSPKRRFYREPPPHSGRGAPRKHGEVMRLPDPATHGTPDRSATATDPTHGQVRVDVWEGLHAQWAAKTPITLLRVEVEHRPDVGAQAQATVAGVGRAGVALGPARPVAVV